jgi:hypothetical protein
MSLFALFLRTIGVLEPIVKIPDTEAKRLFAAHNLEYYELFPSYEYRSYSFNFPCNNETLLGRRSIGRLSSLFLMFSSIAWNR